MENVFILTFWESVFAYGFLFLVCMIFFVLAVSCVADKYLEKARKIRGNHYRDYIERKGLYKR